MTGQFHQDDRLKGLLDSNASKRFYEKRYEKGYMENWEDYKVRRIVGLLQELGLPPEGKALDFGCGNGILTRTIHQALPNWKVYGADISSVAIRNARAVDSDCHFFELGHSEQITEKFDLIFTHHVWEHVPDFDAAWKEMLFYAKPTCNLFHILPCADPGSLEFEICSLRLDGVNPEMGNRFFFEDEGHLRRLTTDEMVNQGLKSGFRLFKAYYANQLYGGINWITKAGPHFVLKLCDTRKAKDGLSKSRLARIRAKLLWISAFRMIPRLWAMALRGHGKALLFTAIGFPLFVVLLPFGLAIDRWCLARSEAEWEREKTKPNGSEMYLYFTPTC